MHSLNKYAYDVITVAVTDHFNELGEDEEPDYEKLKGDLYQALEKNAMSRAKPGALPSTISVTSPMDVSRTNKYPRDTQLSLRSKEPTFDGSAEN